MIRRGAVASNIDSRAGDHGFDCFGHPFLSGVYQQYRSCVDGSLLARFVLGFVQAGRVQSCVRPVDAVLMTAGPNAIRRIGSQSLARACEAP